jgi:formate hydrogenlyase subunit 3/multisubunit Na+/H+ antiporter MnhD subunit
MLAGLERLGGMNILVGNDWKTTAAGLLSAFASAIGPLSGFLAAWQAIQAQIPGHGPANYTLALIGAGLTCAAAIARAWIGLLQNYVQSDPNIGKLANPAIVNVATTGPVPEIPATPIK